MFAVRQLPNFVTCLFCMLINIQMYIPKINSFTDRPGVVRFMKQFGFATIITAKDNLPVATHLPFVVSEHDGNLILSAHFAKANDHWTQIEDTPVLVIFSEPHAYISP